MSQVLDPIAFPLKGSRLIEASAGTGKTWTIAALYVRLVLGHESGLARPLLPADILVMTFTRSATRELNDRIRERLVEAARYFRGMEERGPDAFLKALRDGYPDLAGRQQAAHRLAMAAEAMDDAAILTLDAWCQRMLRQHAFDSGCLFEEELVTSEAAITHDAIRDYWRMHVYALDAPLLAAWRACWDATAFEKRVLKLVRRADAFPPAGDSLGKVANDFFADQARRVHAVKEDFRRRGPDVHSWLLANLKAVIGTTPQARTINSLFAAMLAWANDPGQACLPDDAVKTLNRLSLGSAGGAQLEPGIVPPPAYAVLHDIVDLAHDPKANGAFFLRHAVPAVAARIAELKHQQRQAGFADMLNRLRDALEGTNSTQLRARIVAQFPVAMVDEFQDTSPTQYQVLDRLYKVADSDPSTALLLIGDPKQAIYGFRGADIHSYLAARTATAGRHYRLDTNYRSTRAVVDAINHVFLHAEGDVAAARAGHPRGAFRFRNADRHPVPFEAAGARGRSERFGCTAGDPPALTVWCNDARGLTKPNLGRHFASHCAATIAGLLNDPACGFSEEGRFTRLVPGDIAVIVRDRYEAHYVRQALRNSGVPSVYLSDKDSVFKSTEAADVARWLAAISAPLDAAAGRLALATQTVGLSLAELASHVADERVWESRVEMFKRLRVVWQRQGVLAMLRRFIHEMALASRSMQVEEGERRLTNVLHLAELCQQASQHLDGEQALMRWLDEQVSGNQEDEEHVLRLESEARLVQVVTVYKAKGLEYPLVFLPYATAAYPVAKSADHYAYTAADGRRVIDLEKSAAGLQAADDDRLGEEVRLFYVALTRARHALWVGACGAGTLDIGRTAFGYLLAGDASLTPATLEATLAQVTAPCPGIAVVVDTSPAPTVRMAPREERLPLAADVPYGAVFERNWHVSSYSALTRSLGKAASTVPADAGASMPAERALAVEALLADEGTDDDAIVSRVAGDTSARHQFPRGAHVGTFLHDQLEWMARDGLGNALTDSCADELARRCSHAGWHGKAEVLVPWLRDVVTTPLPHLGCALSGLERAVPEMEFWVPAGDLDVAALDKACREAGGVPGSCPPLRATQLHGMLHGFIDLVCEADGRYWVLDYKSNALGKDDAAYFAPALAEAVASHRYDVQGALYMHALNALLASRLGAHYDPDRHLGGAIFYFLRGVGNETTRGCHRLPSTPALRATLGTLLGTSFSRST